MDRDQIDNMLISKNLAYKEKYAENYIGHYIEQYRIYLHLFDRTSDRRHKSNEFFLGVNTAIMGIMGYIEAKNIEHTPVIFFLAPIVGVAICFCWYRLIMSVSQLNRAKFKVIHNLEKNLPLNLFETEWHLLGNGKDSSKYYPISHTERFIPLIFIFLYIVIFLANFTTLGSLFTNLLAK